MYFTKCFLKARLSLQVQFLHYLYKVDSSKVFLCLVFRYSEWLSKLVCAACSLVKKEGQSYVFISRHCFNKPSYHCFLTPVKNRHLRSRNTQRKPSYFMSTLDLYFQTSKQVINLVKQTSHSKCQQLIPSPNIWERLRPTEQKY